MDDNLVNELLQGSRRALARLLTMVENEREDADRSLAALFPHTGKAWVIGVTGAPGTGKSSLVNMLTKAFRVKGNRVAIIAIDPTSPFTGGAILGDRIRMRDLSGDEGIFIRSMAARGNLGGLSRATRDAVRVFDAAGFDIVLIETVGAGQNEIDIVRASQTIIVVEAPGLGDEVQAIKAGILEIANVLVVNKSDRPGATQTARALRNMLEMGHPAARSSLIDHHGRLVEVATPLLKTEPSSLWIPPIVQTVATDNKGVEELLSALEGHRQHLLYSADIAQVEAQQIEIELRERLETALLNRFLQIVSKDAIVDVIARIQQRQLDPHHAVYQLLALSGIDGKI